MRPLIAFTNPELMASPSPVPASPLVVKNGSNTRSMMSGGTPGPVSSTITTTRSSTRRASITTFPPRPVAATACSAFARAFRSTCCNS